MIPAILAALGELGAGAGMAAGGAAQAGEAAAANVMLPKSLTNLIPIMKDASNIAGGLGRVFKGVNSVFGVLKSVAGIGPKLALSAFEKLVEVGGTVAEVVQNIASLVKTANPAVFKQYEWAVKDATAVFGHMLIPVLQVITKIVRDVGDNFASMNGLRDAFRKLADGLQAAWVMVKPVVAALIDGIDGLFQIFASFAQVLKGTGLEVVLAGMVGAWELIAAAMMGATKAIALMIEVLGKLSNPADLLKQMRGQGEGIGAFMARRWEEMNKKGSAVGAAAGNASFMGFEEVGRKAQMAGFALAGTNQTPEEKANNQREQQINYLKILAEAVGDIPNYLINSATRLITGH